MTGARFLPPWRVPDKALKPHIRLHCRLVWTPRTLLWSANVDSRAEAPSGFASGWWQVSGDAITIVCARLAADAALTARGIGGQA